MARVTVEDCVRVVPNRFDLVLLSAQRSRQIAAGASLTVPRDNDRNPVVALREIAEKTLSLEDMQEAIIQGLQKHLQGDVSEDEFLDTPIEENAYAGEAAHRQELEALAIEEDDFLEDTTEEE